MIRLRIEKEVKTFSKEGLIFYKGGRSYQVIIEELPDAIRADLSYNGISNPFEDEPEWIPVEVIDAKKD